MWITEKIEKILKALSADKWVKASELREETGLNPWEIGGIINYNMLNKVDRRKKRSRKSGTYFEYRRRVS